MTVVMAVEKCCAASGRALQAESAASEVQDVKIHLRKTAKSRQMHVRKTVCSDEFATVARIEAECKPECNKEFRTSKYNKNIPKGLSKR